MEQIPSAGKHIKFVKRDKTHNGCQARENMLQRPNAGTNLTGAKARENTERVLSAGKHVTSPERGKTCNAFEWPNVQNLFKKRKSKCNSKSRFWRWMEMFSDKSLPHWNMLTWWLSPSNTSLGLLFRPCKTNVAVNKWFCRKSNLRELLFWGFSQFKGNLAHQECRPE